MATSLDHSQLVLSKDCFEIIQVRFHTVLNKMIACRDVCPILAWCFLHLFISSRPLNHCKESSPQYQRERALISPWLGSSWPCPPASRALPQIGIEQHLFLPERNFAWLSFCSDYRTKLDFLSFPKPLQFPSFRQWNFILPEAYNFDNVLGVTIVSLSFIFVISTFIFSLSTHRKFKLGGLFLFCFALFLIGP